MARTDQSRTSRLQGESSARERRRLRSGRSFRSACASGDNQRRTAPWRNKLGRKRRLCARQARGPRSCENCAKQACPSPRFFRSSLRMEIAISFSNESLDRPLLAAKRMQPPRTSWRRAERILEQLGPMLARVHAAGWMWRDCKPSHILFHGGTLRLIDFEGACRIDETEILPWGSPDYIPPPYRGKFSRRAGTLEDDYALGVIAFQFLSGKFPPRSSRRRASIYKETRCPDSIAVQDRKNAACLVTRSPLTCHSKAIRNHYSRSKFHVPSFDTMRDALHAKPRFQQILARFANKS